ncbi:MAG: hypothetical protein HOP25_09030 [Methylotenera sp.]|nr:hypothetical protein [Methylotenera sp.]
MSNYIRSQVTGVTYFLQSVGVVSLMKKGRLVNNLDKRCANKKQIAHPTLAKLISKNYRYYYFFALFFIPIIPLEISSHFVNIPKYESLNSDFGRVAYTRASGRWGHQFILINSNKKEMLMTCHLDYSDSMYCPPFDTSKESSFFQGKTVKARWYRHSFAGYTSSNILLELEVDGQKLMKYDLQKEKYLHQIGDGSHIGLMMFMFFLGLGIYGHQESKYTRRPFKN